MANQRNPASRLFLCFAAVMVLFQSYQVVEARPVLVRASTRGDAIVVVLEEPNRNASVWVRTGSKGASFTRHDFPNDRWVLDARISEDGDVLIAHGSSPRGGPIMLTHIGAEAIPDVTLAGTNSISTAHFIESADRFALLTADGGYLSDDGGRTLTKLGNWDVETYPFYAATARFTSATGVEILAPEFNTCGSSDLFEGLFRIRAASGRPATVAPVSISDVYNTVLVTLGANGERYSAIRRGRRACVLQTKVSGRIHDLFQGTTRPCHFYTQTNDRFTVARFGSSILSLSGADSHLLGEVGEGDIIRDIAPDSRGRALVLLRGDRVVRYSRRHPDEVIFTRPPVAQ